MVLLGTITAGQDSPEPCTELQHILASDGSLFDEFGRSVSVSGNRALVGASGDDNNGSGSGSAYVYFFDGTSWTDETPLVPKAEDNPMAGDQFGRSVSLSGDRALIGAPGQGPGAAYVFHFDGASWSREEKLVPAELEAGDAFGASVSLSGDVALVGAIGDDDNGNAAGAAYAFHFDGLGSWEQKKILASDGSASDLFGRAVSVDGHVALITAPNADSQSGWAYVFSYDEMSTSWIEDNDKIDPADGQPLDAFGESASLSGDLALISAASDDDNGTDSGSAYVYRCVSGTWTLEQKLLASDGEEFEAFGFPVAASGDTLAVACILDDDYGVDSGSVYVFRRSGGTWVEDQKLLASDGDELAEFGSSVAIDGDVVIVGATVSGIALSPGEVYAFDLLGPEMSTVDLSVVPDAVLVDYFAGSNICVSGANHTGDSRAVGRFACGQARTGIGAGILLSTGDIASVPGPNVSDGISSSFGLAGDPYLDTLATSLTQDASVLDFEFEDHSIAPGQAATLEFRYVFASDGYNEDVGTAFTDVFGVFLNGTNIARGPFLAAPISVDTVNCGSDGMPPGGTNCAYYVNNDLDDGGGALDVEMDGLTVPWYASGTFVGPGPHCVRIGIADVGPMGDDTIDSVVFLQAGSLVARADVDADGLGDAFETGFGGTVPEDSILIVNPETAGVATFTGSAADGATITTGTLSITFPAGTTVDTGIAPQIGIEYAPGPFPAVEIQGADLMGQAKSIEMPMGNGVVVCLEDAPLATIESVQSGTCVPAPPLPACPINRVEIAIPAIVGDATIVTTKTPLPECLSATYTVTRISPGRIRIDGLRHTAVGLRRRERHYRTPPVSPVSR